MKNFIVDIHGDFDPPLLVSSSLLGDSGGRAESDDILLKGFYASRRVSAASTSYAIDSVLSDIRRELGEEIEDVYSIVTVEFSVESIEEAQEVSSISNSGFTFYGVD